MEVDEPAGTSMDTSVDETGAAGGSQTQQVKVMRFPNSHAVAVVSCLFLQIQK